MTLHPSSFCILRSFFLLPPFLSLSLRSGSRVLQPRAPRPASSSASNYVFYFDAAKLGAVPTSQRVCEYIDEIQLTASPVDEGALFLATATTRFDQMANLNPECASMGHSYCGWTTVDSESYFTADVEMFSLTIQHAFRSTSGIAGNGYSLQGYLLDQQNNIMDPCVGYASSSCDKTLADVGSVNSYDHFPLRTLFLAAGMYKGSLDVLASDDPSYLPLEGLRLREAGLVLLVEIHYTNYFAGDSFSALGTGSFDSSKVIYFYKVTKLTNKGYTVYEKFANYEYPATQGRQYYVKSGVRIVVTTTARVDSFSFFALLVSCSTGLAFLAIGTYVVDIIMMSLCPLAPIYK